MLNDATVASLGFSSSRTIYSKTCFNRPLKKNTKMGFKTDYRLLSLKSGQREHSAILSTLIKLPFVLKTFVLTIFEWSLNTGLSVCTTRISKEKN